jgi:hypothetical protein
MRILVGLAALLLAVAFDARSGANAQAKWCAWYDAYTYNCGFHTFNQCMATIQGIGGICRRNVQTYGREEPRRQRRPR